MVFENLFHEVGNHCKENAMTSEGVAGDPLIEESSYAALEGAPGGLSVYVDTKWHL